MTQHINTDDFSSLTLREPLLNNLATLNYTTMTPIQAQSLPRMLKGEDIIAKAKTGTGKTAAFGLALLNQLVVENFALQSLVLCPTRELAEQVCQALRQLARLLPNVKVLNLSGGIPLRPQVDSLRHGAHIIVGTPGRILKHLDKETVSLRSIKTLVLDEADRMLDMGFYDDIKLIISACPQSRQTLLFSATYPDEVKKLAKQLMVNPTEITVETPETVHDIMQQFYEAKNPAEKFTILKALLMHHKPSSALIFCNTKQLTAELADKLMQNGFSALSLNGDLEQVDRDQVLIQFINQSCSILVATDVAARGIDIKELPLVINYELAFEKDVHTHRIGRTGRAGHQGLALSITLPSDGERLCAIEEESKKALTWATINDLPLRDNAIAKPPMITLCLDSGRKDKIRPGDILGALTKDGGLPGEVIGKIDILPLRAYVAIKRSHADKAYQYLLNGKLKGRKVNVRKLR